MNIIDTSHQQTSAPALHAVGRAAREAVAPQRPRSWPPLALAGSLAAAALAPAAWAGPDGGTVAQGQAQIARSGNLTAITQQSNRAVIDWRSFNVGASEAVDFRQPSAAAATLNRVLATDPSAILGRITANGSVFIVNPNGILFGQGAQINVGGIVASTANISNANFMSGNYRFDEPGRPGAKVENRGTIRVADSGIAALAGRQVSNSGFIIAKLGKVALAGGDAFTLDLAGDRLISLILDPATMDYVQDAQGVPLIARVDNTGSIQADGGRVLLSANTVSALLDNVINVQGDIRAGAVTEHNGVISLLGGATTAVTMGGVLQAGAHGGLIEAAGRDVSVASGAKIDLGAGGDLRIDAARNIGIDASLNALRADAVAGAAATLAAGNDIAVNAPVALNNGALAMTAGGRVLASGAVLQAGDQAITLSGRQGVAAGSVLTSGAVNLASSEGTVSVASGIGAVSDPSGAALPAAGVTIAGRDGVALNGVLALGNLDVRSSAGSITSNASLESRSGNVELQAATDITASGAGTGLVAATGDVKAQAGGALSAPSVIAARDIQLTAGGTLGVAQTLGAAGTGASRSVSVEAVGDVTLAGARAGTGGLSVRSTAGSVASAGASAGLVSAGGASVAALGGTAGTQAAALNVQAAGDVWVEGRDGVALNVLTTPGGVLLRSAAGGVSVASGISGTSPAPGTSTSLESAAASGSVRVESAGAVSLAGAKAGAGGIDVGGATAGSRAAAFTLSGGSLLSAGNVKVATTGPIAIGSLVSSAGGVSLDASTGGMSIDAPVVTTGAGQPITLVAGGNVALNAPLKSANGAIGVTSNAGSVTAKVATPGADPTDGDAIIDAGDSATASNVTVRGRDGVTLGGVRGHGSVTLASTAGDVRLLSPLGGKNTGYTNYDLGYQQALRPDVGVLTIDAGRSVELNGLNLDGIANPADVNSVGLHVQAGKIILSNATIAVNKGGIELLGGDADATDGVYLGANVFSRGWDSVGAGGARTKRGYGITIDGRVLGLFDNNNDVADLPGLFRITVVEGGQPRTYDTDWQGYLVDAFGVRTGQRIVKDDTNDLTITNDIHRVDANDPSYGVINSVLGQPVTRVASKIEISNNVANYAEQSVRDNWLVPVTLDATQPVLPLVAIDSTVINGVLNGTAGTGAGRQSLPGFVPTLGSLSQVPVGTPAPVAAGKIAAQRGMVLKLLGFRGDQDVSTEVWGNLAFTPTGKVYPTTTGLDPTKSSGTNDVFSSNDGSGYTSGPTRNGTFTVTVHSGFLKDSVLCDVSGTCEATYTMQRLEGPLSVYAYVKSITVNGTEGWVPEAGGFPSNPAVNDIVQLRFGSTPGFEVTTAPGTTDGVRVQATLNSGGSYGGTVLPNGAAAPRLQPSAWPVVQQNADGTLSSLLTSLAGQNPAGYQLGRVIVDAATSASRPNEAGTRVLIYDGVLDSPTARAVGDASGGPNYIPGVGLIDARNNSTTTYGSIGTVTTTTTGQSSGAGTGATTSTTIGASGGAGAGAGTGIGGAPVPPGDSGFVFTSSVSDRTAQDALAQAEQSTSTVSQTSDGTTEVGSRPAAQADLGRGGALSGAATNVFKRSYRIATSVDPAVCAPGAIANKGKAAKPATPSGGKPASAESDAARECGP